MVALKCAVSQWIHTRWSASHYVSKHCVSTGWNEVKKKKKNTTPRLPSLTQGAFIKAGFMQGGGWPLWGDPCTAGGLFWREQQDHIWPQRTNRTAVTNTSNAPKIPSIQPAQPYIREHQQEAEKLICSTYSTVGVFIICISTKDASTCRTDVVRVTTNPHKHRGNNR